MLSHIDAHMAYAMIRLNSASIGLNDGWLHLITVLVWISAPVAAVATVVRWKTSAAVGVAWVVMLSANHAVSWNDDRGVYSMFGYGGPGVHHRLKRVLHGRDVAATTTTTTPDGVDIVFITDTHMHHHSIVLPPGDILVHTGDFTNFGTPEEVRDFDLWLGTLPYTHKIVVPGNHDMCMDEPYWEDHWEDWGGTGPKECMVMNATVLRDSAVDIMGLRFFGSAHVPKHDSASWTTGFNRKPDELGELWDRIFPDCVDVLATHTPPLGHLDLDMHGLHRGCHSLKAKVDEVKPQIHAFGHVHSHWGFIHDPADHQPITHLNANATGGGIQWPLKTIFVNSAAVSDFYSVRSHSAVVVTAHPGVCVRGAM